MLDAANALNLWAYSETLSRPRIKEVENGYVARPGTEVDRAEIKIPAANGSSVAAWRSCL